MLTFLHPSFSYLAETTPESHVVRFEQFSDGWPRIFLEDKNQIAGKNVTYIGDFRYVDDLFGQIAFLDGLARYSPDRIDIVVPFFPAASMERDTPSGELSIANVFARALGLIGERKPGHVLVHLYDIHDERELFYFPPSLQVIHHTTTEQFKKKVLGKTGISQKQEVRGSEDFSKGVYSNVNEGEKLETNKEIRSFSEISGNPVILFPDTGAKKAFSRFFEEYDVVTCAKVRKGPNEIEMYFEGGNLEGKEVFIIDDHIRSGGTLVEACRYAREKGAIKVSAFAPHAVFADGIKESFLSAFDQFYTTDTIPENHERFKERANVQVLHFL